jgi:hypothetical protein
MASEDEEFTMLFQEFYPSLCRFLECLLGGRATWRKTWLKKFPATASHGMGNFAG